MVDGTYIIGGEESSFNGDFADTDSYGGTFDIFAANIDTNGDVLWVKSYGGSNEEYTNSVTATRDGGFIMTGYTKSTDGTFEGVGTGVDNAFVMKLDAEGNIEWQDVVNSSSVSRNHSAIELDDEYLVLGRSQGYDLEMEGYNKGATDTIVYTYSKDGARDDIKVLGGSGNDYASQIRLINDTQVGVLGFSNSNDYDFEGLNIGGYDNVLAVYTVDKQSESPYSDNSDEQAEDNDNVKVVEGFVEGDICKVEISADTLLDIVSKGLETTIIVDADGEYKEISVNISSEVLSILINTEVQCLTIVSELLAISLDLTTIKEIYDQLEGSDIVLSGSEYDVELLSNKNKDFFANRGVFGFTITDGKNKVTEFNGGTVTVQIPYVLESNEKSSGIGVYYVELDDTLTLMSTSYNRNSEMVTFKTNHFSVYGIGYEEVDESATDGENGSESQGDIDKDTNGSVEAEDTEEELEDTNDSTEAGDTDEESEGHNDSEGLLNQESTPNTSDTINVSLYLMLLLFTLITNCVLTRRRER